MPQSSANVSDDRGKLLLLLAILLGVTAGLGLCHGVETGGLKFVAFAGVAFVLGALTGLAEIFPKYKDDPVRAACCLYGLLYWLLNAFISLTAFWLVWAIYRRDWGLVDGAGQLVVKQSLKYAAFSGLGAMALLRSKFFKITLKDGREVSVGPDHIVSTLLESTDAYIDRHRALVRARLVEEKFGELDFASLLHHAPTLIFGALQTLTPDREGILKTQIASIGTSPAPNHERSLQLGFLMVNYLGEDFIRAYDFDEILQPPKAPPSAPDPLESPQVPGPPVVSPAEGATTLPVSSTESEKKSSQALRTQLPIKKA